MIDAFVDLLAAAADLRLIDYDEHAIRSPHRAAVTVDPDAVAADADRLHTEAAALADLTARLGAATGEQATGERATGDDTAWSGAGGHAAVVAIAEVSGRIVAAAADLADRAAVLTAAHIALGDVVARYRAAMATVADPVLAGVDVRALPAALAVGSPDRETVRAELADRIEYADAVAAIADAAITRIVEEAAAAPSPATTGQLVLAGDR